MSDFENNTLLLITLVRSAISGESLPSDVDFEGRFNELIKLASLHQVAHLSAYALIRNGSLKSEKKCKYAQKQVYNASYSDTKNRYTLEVASSVLTEAKIPFIPLKGAIIKNYYPEKWMRSSCDIDVLVQKKDFKNAVSILENNGFVIKGNLNYHDISLYYDGTNLELHFSVCENIKNIDAVLKYVWNYAAKKTDYEYEEDHDFFVFHHIAHMSYHFLAGGCGIRPFLDLWILNKQGFFDEDNVKKLCADAKISEFYSGVKQLVDVWFEGASHSDITRRMERYITTGGAYGYFPNNAAAETIRRGGKIHQVLSIAFPPYTNMRAIYPFLNRVPVALPLFYVYRVFQKTVGKNSEKAKQKYRIIKQQDSKFIKEVATLMKMLDLDSKKGGKP